MRCHDKQSKIEIAENSRTSRAENDITKKFSWKKKILESSSTFFKETSPNRKP